MKSPRLSFINRARRLLAGLIAPKAMSNVESVREGYARARVYHSAPTDYKKEVSSNDRVELMRLTRSLEKNSGVVRAYVAEQATYAVGDSGIVPEIQHSEDDWREEAEAVVEEANQFPTICGRFTLVELETLLCRAIDVDGDVFAAFVIEPETGAPKVQVFEAHRVGNGSEILGSEPGWSDGIKFDSFGRPVAYRVLLDDGSTRDIPASAVCHIYEPEHYSGVRGTSPLISSIPTLRDLREILSAEKTAVKELSRVARVLTSTSGEFDEDDGASGVIGTGPGTNGNGTDPDLIDRRAGGVTVAVGPGEKLEQFNTSSRPSPAFTGFVDHLTRDALVATGIPSDFLVDPNKMGGAVVRLVVGRVERRIKIRQNALEKFLRRWTNFVLATAIQSGRLRAVEGWEKSAVFVFPRRLSVDAGRESNANRADIEFGLKRFSDDFAERGLNFRRELAGRARDFAEIIRVSKESGVPLEMLVKPSFAWLFPAYAPSTKKPGQPGGEAPATGPAPEMEEPGEAEDEEGESEEENELDEEESEALASTARLQSADDDLVSVPAYYRSNCRKGLSYVKKGLGGDGLKRQTINEAESIASSGKVRVEKLRRLSAWLKRHKTSLDSPKNRNPKAPGYPGPGLVAWLLWAGDSNGSLRAAEWADATLARLDREGS